MSYLRGPDRAEVQLLPACLDDYVPANSPVRFIDVYVEGLDLLALGFGRAVAHTTGRPPYHPADLLRLYLYGYLYRIRSSRRLEAEAGRNLELMWLIRMIRPDFKTIADFRKENIAAFKALFRQFNLLCRKLNLFSAELVAIDGTKFKAMNNRSRNFTHGQLAELIQQIDARIESYLAELESRDGEAEGAAAQPKEQALQEKINQLKERKGRYDQLLGELQQSGQTQASLTDIDARNMKGPHGHLVGYNVQVAVDSKHALIVAEEVVQDRSDCAQLSAMAIAAKDQLQVTQLQVVADKGYHSADQLAACEQANIEPVVPRAQSTGGRTTSGKTVLPKQDFHFDAEANLYRCPQGHALHPYRKRHGREAKGMIYENRAACRACPIKERCTTAPWRTITRWENEAAAERCAQRVAQRPKILARRREIVEHVFGTLRQWGHDRFLMRGLKKVRGEFSLSALVYNLKRVLNIFGCQTLMEKARAAVA